MNGDTVPDCQDCGACCHAQGTRYVRVTGADHAAMGDRAATLTQFVGHRCFMRMEDGHCVSLRVVDGRYVCQDYEIRPAICRDLERGSDACLAERERKLPLRGQDRGSV